MQLLVIVLNKTEYLGPLLTCMLERNISGDENHTALELITPESKLEAGSYLATLFLEGQKLTTRIIIR